MLSGEGCNAGKRRKTTIGLISVSNFARAAHFFVKVNTLHNTDSISAFPFRLYWLLCSLCFTRRRWLCDFPPKQPRVAFGLPYLLIELLDTGMSVVRTDILSGGLSVTWLSNFLRWADYFIYLPMVLRRRVSRERAPLQGSRSHRPRIMGSWPYSFFLLFRWHGDH